ncbi:cytochrome P460 family protein [Chryseobacterium angstadtii]|uniref:cytochrome P460 family protein n=1 Tax=Chryseobacterium angstadtii TaxID=558151 RepID=UPI00065AF6CB|nr:cytochrome P460 family protein [Chryseobacterium angstadtii]
MGPDKKAPYTFDEKGELIRPTNYRTWVFAGTGTTPKAHDSTAIFPDFQNIYIDPESYEYWKENGYFREGTIFVKELIRKGDTISPIGKGFYQGEAYSLSATIKDTVRFPNSPGGWEYFKYTDYEKGILTESSPALGGSCISCHSNAKAGYGPFHELYMVLRDAKKAGKNNPENLNTRGGLKPEMPSHMREKE